MREIFLRSNKDKKLPVKRQINICKKLSILLSAGVPISKAVRMSGMPKDSERRILDGESISKAIEPYFTRTVVSFARIGERTAEIDKMFALAAEALEFNSRLKEKVIGAFIYPSLVLMTSIITAVFFVMFIIPQMEGVFSAIGTELPLSVIFLLNVSRSMPYMIAFIFILAVPFIFILKNGIFAERVERTKYNLPLFGNISRKTANAEIAKNISFLLAAGITHVEAISEAAKMTGSSAYSSSLLRIKALVENGESVSSAFNKERLFERNFSEMLLVGEETGNIGPIIEGMSAVLEEEAHSSIKTAASLIEPLSTVFVGAFVAFIVVVMMSPMVKLLSTL